jgi:hypothetical protein
MLAVAAGFACSSQRPLQPDRAGALEASTGRAEKCGSWRASCRGDEPLTILASNGSRALVFCTCAKCGSTSAYRWFFSALYGTPFSDDSQGSFLHNHAEWTPRLPTVPVYSEAKLPAEGTMYLALVRDPLARYLSAYKSKLACWDEGVEKRDRPFIVNGLVSLARESGLNMTASRSDATAAGFETSSSHLTKADATDDPCLSFEQFTTALSAVHEAGNAEDLNDHLLPQDLALAPCAHGLLAVASEMELLAPMLQRSYELHPNATWQKANSGGDALPELDAPNVRRLCEVARRELLWLGKAGVALPEASGEPLTVANCAEIGLGHLGPERLPVTP